MSSFLIPDWPVPANVRALVTTRCEGESSDPFASNNLALHVGDQAEAVENNRQRLLSDINTESDQPLSVQWLEQVHGTKVVEAQADDRVRTADGSITAQTNVICGVLTADCLPLLLCDRAGTQVAAVHAGWRGTCARIAGVMVKTLAEAGFEPAELVAAIGPSIGPDRFEIGPEVATTIREAYPDSRSSLKPGCGDRWLADLWELNRQDLTASGIPEHQIDVAGVCTHQSGDYFSYRRDGGVTGRQVGAVALV